MSRREDRPRGPAAALYRLALRAFPARHRERYGDEMLCDAVRGHRERRRSRGALAAASYLLRAVADAARAGLGERLRRHEERPIPGGGTRWQGRERAGGLGELGADLRHALRSLLRAPGFTVAAVVVLGLGIGANTAVFSALRAVLLAPSPYPDTERIVFPKVTWAQTAGAESRTMPWSWLKFEMLRESASEIVAPLGVYADRTATLSEPGRPERIDLEMVTPEYFDVLGVEARVGRTFAEAEGGVGEPPGVALLSHALWTERFAGDPSAIGSRVVLNGIALTVVGVLPRGFGGLTGGAQVWVPMGEVPRIFSPWMIEGSGAHWLHAVGRLREGVPVEDARDRIRALGEEIEEAFRRDRPADYGATLQTFAEVRQNPSARTSVLVLSAAAGLVLLIAVANLASLLLARASARRRETAVRLALGAGRWRLVRGVIVETLVLALVGGLAGLAVAYVGTGALRAAWPDAFLRSVDDELRVVDVGALGLDGATLLFAFGVALLTGVLFGVLPALRHSRIHLVPSLKEGRGATRPAGGRKGAFGGRRLLVGAQSALALVLLVGAGLMLSTLAGLQSVERGFDGENLLVFRYTLSGVEEEARQPFHDAYLERLRALPGVRDAAMGGSAPLAGYSMVTVVSEVEGRPEIPRGEEPSIAVQIVEPGFLETLGVPVLRGRNLEPGDGTPGAPPVVTVISRTAARELFGEVDPVGRTLEMGISFTEDGGRYRVLGVVDDLLYGPPEEGFMPVAYLPRAGTGASSTTVLVRTGGDPLDLVPAAREALAELDPGLPLYGITTARDLEAEVTGDTRVVLGLLALFAGLALLLTATGLYAVVAHAVADRRRELGLRMALGARSGQVAGMVLRQGLATAAAGVALGALGAWAATRLLESLLYEVSATDPAAFLGAVGLLLAVAAVASWLPARRATRLDPVETLRTE